jgi:hypothetical protein
VLVVLMCLPGAASGQSPPGPGPAAAVFRLSTLDSSGGGYRSVLTGTAFFVSADGTALTNSHVVYSAVHSPDRYSLIAVVGDEFYGAAVVCASRLPYDAERMAGKDVPFSRDVAEIKVISSRFPFTRFVYRTPDGSELTIATAHRGDLPRFPVLPVGKPAMGAHVRVIGFGSISPILREWTATGMISGLLHLEDGTDALEVEFTNPPEPGNSGSPVLNDRDEIVGIWTWHSSTRADMGWAQSSSTLSPPCR